MQATPSRNQRLDKTPVLSGALGIVIIPDETTIKQSYSLAAEILPSSSEFVLSPGSLPHLTLYHGKLLNVLVDEAAALIEDIRGDVISQKFTLNRIVGFGGNFVFWNVARDSDPFEKLEKAHATALGIARYLDRDAPSKATSEEALSLSPAELENVQLFGHPLVRQLYTPHITLGFNKGVVAILPANLERTWEFKVASVEMARIGYPGRIEEIVNLKGLQNK